MDKVAEITFVEDMAFEVEVNNHKFIIDADESVGGKDRGPRPKPLTLASLGGCTGMDVISILKKMRVKPDYFNVVVSAEMTQEHPKYYNKIKIVYEFRGEDLPLPKLEKAINLSQDRYCGVTAMLIKVAEITHEIKILK
ncbi:MAG: osmotically inducible protein C [Bacteroidetes bacterium 4484_276]|nr:MAG: osmotically inducible protein C [Bacteroidetes bacterium 4484_276]OYT14244.1 MAG: osmotically inducible protein C [Bacteroidetes bacterium 4572_114]